MNVLTDTVGRRNPYVVVVRQPWATHYIRRPRAIFSKAVNEIGTIYKVHNRRKKRQEQTDEAGVKAGNVVKLRQGGRSISNG